MKLYLLAKEKKTRGYHALYDKTYREDILQKAWRKVKQNAGSAGIDDAKRKDYASLVNLVENMGLATLAHILGWPHFSQQTDDRISRDYLLGGFTSSTIFNMSIYSTTKAISRAPTFLWRFPMNQVVPV